MPQKKFGSLDSTGRKLDVIGAYLEIYQKALSGKFEETIYVDAFAGSGEVPIGQINSGLLADDDEARNVLVGSAVRAVEVDPPFSRYIFIDKQERCIEALRQRLQGNKNYDRIEFYPGDANELVQVFCKRGEWKSRRGVVLLDPFGSQVAWATVEAIAATRALDLWYLFPAGLSVFRQISSDGRVDSTHEPSLTRIFGTVEWKSAFLRPSAQDDLFGDAPRQEKVVTAESAANFMIDRMKSVFRGGVLDIKIPLGNKRSYPLYYLLFAWGNESPKAKELAMKLSKAAIKITDRKYGRSV
ncbi:MAG: three-Cys-motif partner protein TcmP [Kiloniellaceae bacterium]